MHGHSNRGGCDTFCPPHGAPPPSGTACLGEEGGRLDFAACVNLMHRRCLVITTVTVLQLSKPPKFAMGERYVQIPATKMRVAYTFEVVRQAKVAAIFRQGDIDPICRRLINCRSNYEPRIYLYLQGSVGVLLRILVSTVALVSRRLGLCLPPTRVLPMPDGGALWVEYDGALAVRSPLGGRLVWDRNSPLQEPSAGS